jgi:hypothetical protein
MSVEEIMTPEVKDLVAFLETNRDELVDKLKKIIHTIRFIPTEPDSL